jgi:DNA modification methylase
VLVEGEGAPSTLWREATDHRRLHPTQKPVALAARAIGNSTQPGEIVVDCFCGSGGTLVAAERLGRLGYGIELEPGYAAAVLERMSEMGLKPERQVAGR